MKKKGFGTIWVVLLVLFAQGCAMNAERAINGAAGAVGGAFLGALGGLAGCRGHSAECVGRATAAGAAAGAAIGLAAPTGGGSESSRPPQAGWGQGYSGGFPPPEYNFCWGYFPRGDAESNSNRVACARAVRACDVYYQRPDLRRVCLDQASRDAEGIARRQEADEKRNAQQVGRIRN